MKTKLYICTIILIAMTGCAKPPPVNFVIYNPELAWDAALLFDMKCQDFIRATECYKKKSAAQEILKNTIIELKANGYQKATCTHGKPIMNKNHDYSGEFLDFVESRNKKYSPTKDVLTEWILKNYCVDNFQHS